MNPAWRSRPVTIAASAAVLTVIVWFALSPTDNSSPAGPPPARPIANPAAQAVLQQSGRALHGDNDAADILARPLFDPSRRPSAQQAAAATPAATQQPLPRLAGVVINGQNRSAVFATEGNDRTVTVPEGGRFNDFQVESINARQVTIVGRGVKQILRLSFDPNPPQVEAAPSAVLPTFLGQQPPDARPTFNGPPGLANMPRFNPGSPGAPSPFNPNALSGIPGLQSPAPPARP